MTTLTLDGFEVPGTITSMDGWFGTPERRSDAQTRGLGKDGDFPSISAYGSRMMTFRGTYRTAGHEAMHELVDRLAGLFATGRGRVMVEGHGPAQFADVEPVQFLPPIFHTDDLLEWAWQVKAPDPRKYGLVLHDSGQVGTGSAVEVAHAGNYPALPRLNVFAANFPQGYTVYRDGESGYNTRIFQALTSGMVHSVDFATGVSSIQGTTTTGMLGRSRGIEIQPYRLNTLNVVPYESSNQATVRWYWRDTWI